MTMQLYDQCNCLSAYQFLHDHAKEATSLICTASEGDGSQSPSLEI